MKTTTKPQTSTSLRSLHTAAMLALAAAFLFASCTTSGPQPSATGGPRKLTRAERWKAQGWLQVYTTQRWKHASGSPSSFVHATYKLLSPEGHLLMDVLNVGPMDEPEAVRLDPGNYVVEARAFKPGAVEAAITHGAVRIPVNVETGKTTVLHLDE